MKIGHVFGDNVFPMFAVLNPVFTMTLPKYQMTAGIFAMEEVRFLTGQEKIRSRKKHRKLSPVSMGVADFQHDRKKSVSIAISLSLDGILLLVVSSMALARSRKYADT